MRILPLGDSITWGEGSHDGNGYRLILSTLIQSNGNDMEFIGSVKSGNMTNNEHEGHSGSQIDSVGLAGAPTYSQAPNIILLMAGTTDIVSHTDIDGAPDRMATLIEEITSACPDAAVLVGTLIPILDPQINMKTIGFNSAMMGIVWDFTEQGKKVGLVDMGRVGIDRINATDGVHPTDDGYPLMAAAWYDGIIKAGKEGWIEEPSPRPSEDPQNEKVDDNDPSSKENIESIVMHHVKTDRVPPQFLFVVLSALGLLLIARRPLNKFVRRYVG